MCVLASADYIIKKPLRERTDNSISQIEILSNELIKEKEKRRLAQQRFEHSFYHAPIAKALVAPDGSWLEVNDKLCELLGRTRKELMALKFQDVTKAQDIVPDVAFVDEMLSGKIKSYSIAKTYIHKDGSEVRAGLYVTLIHTPIGAPLYFVSQIISEDIAREVLDFIEDSGDER